MIAQHRLVSRHADSSLDHSANTIAATFAKWLTRWRSRRDIEKLLRATDHELADIGLQRSDVERALSFGWRQDASEFLAEIRAERRRAAERRRRIHAEAQKKRISL